ncbi:hypothetical protein M9458_029683, partial [Cirrhinus mrigala]
MFHCVVLPLAPTNHPHPQPRKYGRLACVPGQDGVELRRGTCLLGGGSTVR